MTAKEFIQTYKPFALETERKTGISHLFILAQAALETGWAKSVPGNMFFGVKATADTPGKYKYEVKDWFRKYDTPEECFTDHAQFFFRNKRYAKALLVKSDPYKFAEEVAKAGYATAPNYADSLKKLIKTIENNS